MFSSSPADPTDGSVTVAPGQLPVSTAAAAFPRVNLLPPEIAEEAKVRRAKLTLAGAGAVSVLVVAGLLFVANGQVATAQSEVDVANAQATALQAQVVQYAEVPRVMAQVAAAEQQLSTAMAPEVRWSYVLNDLALTIPKNVSLLSLTGTVSATPPGAAGAAAGVPATPPATSVLGKTGIGTVTFNGEAKSYNAVAAWLDSLAKQKIYVDPYVSTIATQEADATADHPSTVTYTNTVTVSDKALSHRFDGTAD